MSLNAISGKMSLQMTMLDSPTQRVPLRVGDVIKQARETKGLSKAELARQVGVARQTVGDWESHVSAPSRANAPAVARVLAIPLSTISADPMHANVAYIDQEGLTYRKVPLIDFADAGRGITPADPYPAGIGVETVEVTFPVSEATFALEVRGPSMEPVYTEGDVIVVDPQVTPLPDDDVLAELLPHGLDPSNGDITLKRYKPRGSGEDAVAVFDLVPLNPEFQTVTVNRNNPGRIIGTVVEHRIRRRR